MVAEAVYLELSSSDEDDEDHIQNLNDSTDSTRISCLSKVCQEDDDLVIINKPASNDKVKRDKPRVIRSAMDDDECCMLDTDPAAATETAACTPPLDSDELVMTGEKGPVACRDFPHARYLCVHFPFKSTPHANFCTQCHCYVCDSLAPCSLWGDGTGVNDHCHASEDSPWKTLRKLAKCRPLPPSYATPIHTATAAQSAITVSSINSIPTPVGVSRFLPSSTLQAHATTPSPIIRSQVIGPISGVSLQVRRDTTTTTSPLVIRLRGKGRGNPSQPLHLGVRVSRPPPQRSSPVDTFLGNSRSPPVPRPPSAPAPVLPTPAPLPLQQPQFYFGPGSGSAECVSAPYSSQQVPALGTLPGGVGVIPPPVNFSQTMGNGAPFYPSPAPPLPNAPAPYIPPPPPPPFAYAPGAYAPPVAAYDQYPMPVLRPGDATGFIPPFPDSHYVSPNDQQMNMVQEQHFALPRSSYGMDYGVQEHRNPVVSTDCFATPSYGGADEAWAAEAASLFDSFTPNQQPATSLEKVLEQMAGDEYLCEPFPCW